MVALAICLTAVADDPASKLESPDGQKIKEIRIEGNRNVSTRQILAQMGTREGHIFDHDAIQTDINNLYKTGQFSWIDPSTEVTADGVVLTLKVTERARVAAVLFKGARSIAQADLSAAAGITASDFLDRAKVNLAARSVADLYREKGYYFVSVDVDAAALKDNQIVFNIVEGPQVRVTAIRFEGNEAVSDGTLSGEIQTRKYMWLFSKGTLDERVINEDDDRLLQYYHGQGFLSAKVSHELRFAANQRDATVIFVVSEGLRYRVHDVKFEGNTVFAVHEFRPLMWLAPEQFYTTDASEHDTKAIKDELYGAHGYIYAQAVIDHRYTDQEGYVDVVVHIQEGQRIFTGRIDLVGNEYTKDKVIWREMALMSEEPPKPYNVMDERESKRRLMNTGLFSKVEITPTAQGRGNIRDVLVQVTEADSTSFLVGLGASSDQGLFGNISLENRNFDLFGWPRSAKEFFTGKAFKGAGQTLRIVAEPGTQVNRFQLQFFEPYLLDKPISLSTNLFYFTRPRESYDEQRLGYIVAFGRRLGRGWSVEEALRIEDVSITKLSSTAPGDVAKAKGSHILLAARTTLARDTTDNRFEPSSGDRWELSVEPAGGSETFVKLGGDYRVYRTVRTDVFDRKTTVSGRAAVDYILGNAPVYERYYAGGLSTIRGFAYRGVSPRQGVNNDQVGGQFQVLLGGEYSFPIYGKARGVFFVDTGTVETDIGLSSYRASVGFELRIPVKMFGSIPLTFGVAVPVLHDTNDDVQYWHFMFGTSF
ncbi:MAG: Outer membrane protein assembly factor BamA [Phycisphaerae bacterium]|nr:Outer membrane protein assembly factor BamA [Phycisphaerae bacterium]